MSGYQFARLLGGTIIIETIFAVPGPGGFPGLRASSTGTSVVIQAVVLLTAAVVLTLNLIIDLIYGILDPGYVPVRP